MSYVNKESHRVPPGDRSDQNIVEEWVSGCIDDMISDQHSLPFEAYLADATSAAGLDQMISILGNCRCCRRHQCRRPLQVAQHAAPDRPPGGENACTCRCRHFLRPLVAVREGWGAALLPNGFNWEDHELMTTINLDVAASAVDSWSPPGG